MFSSSRIGCSDSNKCNQTGTHSNTTHAERVKTDTPIYAILSQPYSTYSQEGLDKADQYGNFEYAGDAKEALNNTFIMMSHVKYLEQGGARIVPISYRLNDNQLNRILS